ncbi:MAG: hypothetical protein AB7P21_09270 [Lautropia sp.]
MRIGTLDALSAWSAAVELHFDDQRPLPDLDLLIWDTAGIARRFRRDCPATSAPLSVADSELLLSLARHWRSEFRAHLDRGAALVVILAPATRFGVHTLQEVVGFDPLELLPHAIRQCSTPSPNAIRSCAGEPFASFFRRHGSSLVAHGSLVADKGTAVCHIVDDGAAAGLYHHLHPGQWLVLPSLGSKRASGPSTLEAEAFYASISELVARLRGASSIIRIAEWARSPLWPEERAIQAELDQLLKEQEQLRRRRVDCRQRMDAFVMARHLIGTPQPANGQAAAFLLNAMDIPTRVWNATGDVLVSSLPDGSTAVATLCGSAVTPASCMDLAELARCNAQSVSLDESVGAHAWILYAGDHEQPPGVRTGPPAELLERSAGAAVKVVTTLDLLQAYRSPTTRPALWQSIQAMPIVDPSSAPD